MAKKAGLGKGLDSILFDNFTDTNSGVTAVAISRLEARAEQPRKDFEPEALEALAASIKLHGVLQPLVVREVGGGFYQIIAGERRYRAAKLAGLTEVPVVTIVADDVTTAQLAIVENVQREDLNAAEEAFAYRELSTVWNMTQEEIAEKIGKSRSAVANAIRLTELPENIMEMLRSGALSAGHCRALLALDDREVQTMIAEAAKDGGMSVRDVEKAVKKALEAPDEVEIEPSTEINYAKELENKVRRTLGRKVKINVKGKEKNIKIYFEDNEDLDELLTLLGGGRPINL
ncbi:MAG: ParB/RepB/Spo0J family partition protein [Clostridia bacterium]|nr:ParB/RepB/Spo0J family partition protein [Clostridia bacterium]MBQ5648848.1 ParB/RepB/Spo0J family partition protein [Clostridia bacterium]MBQ5809427.1 ParB/RepB/Spo0J family partition protein [Clostridia bacterium]